MGVATACPYSSFLVFSDQFLVLLGLRQAAPSSPLLGALTPTPLGIGVILDLLAPGAPIHGSSVFCLLSLAPSPIATAKVLTTRDVP